SRSQLEPSLIAEPELIDYSWAENLGITASRIQLPLVVPSSETWKRVRVVSIRILEAEAPENRIAGGKLVIHTCTELVEVRSQGPPVQKILTGISVAADRARSVGQWNESGIGHDLRSHAIKAAYRDDVAVERLPRKARAPGRIGHLSRSQWIKN